MSDVAEMQGGILNVRAITTPGPRGLNRKEGLAQCGWLSPADSSIDFGSLTRGDARCQFVLADNTALADIQAGLAAEVANQPLKSVGDGVRRKRLRLEIGRCEHEAPRFSY
jgi:hypothetical protein